MSTKTILKHLKELGARVAAFEEHFPKHMAVVRCRLEALEQPAVSTNVLQGLDARLAKVEKLLPLELPTRGEMVLAKLDYTNGKTYYSVVYHDGYKWRRQGGGSLYQTYERGSHAYPVGVRVVSWCEVVLPT